MFTRNGVIGKSGKWYPCEFTKHIQTCLENIHDAPFVLCQQGEYANTELPPTKAQFETVIAWCSERKKKFEDVAISPAWDKWL